MKIFFSIAVPTTLLFSLMVLAADLNGYVAKYEVKLGGENYDLDLVSILSRSCDDTITAADTLADINSALNGTKDSNSDGSIVICADPGDYKSKGSLTLSTNGTSSVYRVLRLTNAGDAPWELAVGNRATFDSIEARGNYWIVHRIAFNSGGSKSAVDLTGVSNNIFDTILVENFFDRGFKFNEGATDSVLQNSVVRNPNVRSPNHDIQCANAGSATATNVWIVNSELYDCAGDILFSAGIVGCADCKPGLVFENNDIYITSALYCDANGNLDPNGDFAASENGIDLKMGGSSSNIDRIIHNRIWGFKRTLTSCGSDGSAGEAVIIHEPAAGSTTRYVMVQDNIIMDAPYGLSHPNGKPSEISVIGNIFYNIHSNQHSTATGYVSGADTTEVYLNTFVDIQDRWLKVNGMTNGDIRCNLVINSGGHVGVPGTNTDVDYNAYYAVPGAKLDTNPIVDGASVSIAQNTQFCFFRKLRTGAEQVCIDNVRPTAASPHFAQCPGGSHPHRLGSRTGIGVNNDQAD